MSGTDEWNSERPKEERRGHDGPAGMDPEGVIDSNWDEVGIHVITCNILYRRDSLSSL